MPFANHNIPKCCRNGIIGIESKEGRLGARKKFIGVLNCVAIVCRCCTYNRLILLLHNGIVMGKFELSLRQKCTLYMFDCD